MITLLGKTLRKVRVDLDTTLTNMAVELGVSPAYLSSIETGKRDANETIITKMISVLSIQGAEEQEEFKTIAQRSNSALSINLRELEDETAETMTLLARRLTRLSPESIQQIKEITLDDKVMK